MEWETLDLRQFGNGTWYYTSWSVVTTGAGPWCNWEYADPDPGDTVRVPVIEAQSVLQDLCAANRMCLSDYAGLMCQPCESMSLAPDDGQLIVVVG